MSIEESSAPDDPQSHEVSTNETDLRTQIAEEPESAHLNYKLGLLMCDAGKAAEALSFLQKAVQLDPTISHVLSLGHCLETLGATEAALQCYRVCLDKRVDDAELWARYGKVLQHANRNSEAEDAYAKALSIQPEQLQVRISLSRLLWLTDPTRAIECLDKALQSDNADLASRCQLLSVQLLFKEWAGRIENGQKPYHASSLDDLFFHYAEATLEELKTSAADLANAHPDNDWARMTNALTAFATGDLEQAQHKFSSIKEESLSLMAHTIRFDEDFFKVLRKSTRPKILEGLPRVEAVKTCEFDANNVLYMSCNASYFDLYAKPLLRSLSHTGDGHQVHIHLMDSAPGHTEAAHTFCRDLSNVHFAMSLERPCLPENDPAAARAYFHAIRLIRFYHHVKHYDRTLWLMDVDAIFNKSPQSFFSTISGADIALRVRPGRLEPWNQFNACLMGVRPTQKALDYLEYVASYIAYFYQKQQLPWGIDQLAMYASYVDLERQTEAPELSFLDDQVLDYEHNADGILWCSSGSLKLTSYARASGPDDPNATPYDKAFARFSRPDDHLDPPVK